MWHYDLWATAVVRMNDDVATASPLLVPGKTTKNIDVLSVPIVEPSHGAVLITGSMPGPHSAFTTKTMDVLSIAIVEPSHNAMLITGSMPGPHSAFPCSRNDYQEHRRVECPHR